MWLGLYTSSQATKSLHWHKIQTFKVNTSTNRLDTQRLQGYSPTNTSKDCPLDSLAMGMIFKPPESLPSKPAAFNYWRHIEGCSLSLCSMKSVASAERLVALSSTKGSIKYFKISHTPRSVLPEDCWMQLCSQQSYACSTSFNIEAMSSNQSAAEVNIQIS